LEGTFVPGWTVERVWLVSVGVCGLVFLVGLAAVHDIDLTGLLIAGPCVALLTGRWLRTAATGAIAVAGAVVLGLAAGSGTAFEHWVFGGAVGFVAVLNTVTAAWLQRHHARQSSS
jgi:hypothetical protein